MKRRLFKELVDFVWRVQRSLARFQWWLARRSGCYFPVKSPPKPRLISTMDQFQQDLMLNLLVSYPWDSAAENTSIDFMEDGGTFRQLP